MLLACSVCLHVTHSPRSLVARPITVTHPYSWALTKTSPHILQMLRTEWVMEGSRAKGPEPESQKYSPEITHPNLNWKTLCPTFLAPGTTSKTNSLNTICFLGAIAMRSCRDPPAILERSHVILSDPAFWRCISYRRRVNLVAILRDHLPLI